MFLVGCVDDSDDVGAHSDALTEIVQNLEIAGYPASEIAIDDGVVIVGGDAVVSLTASREMIGLDADLDESFRQYRTNNLVGGNIDLICVNGAAFTGTMSTALDHALENYNVLPMQFDFMRTSIANAPGCDATITAKAQGSPGGQAGFPSNGQPYHEFQVGKGTTKYGMDVLTHVIQHELGHCIGLRHSDYYNRAISCGGSPSNEGASDIGAILILGTPAVATLNGSVMNSCFNSKSTGQWTNDDVTALTTLY